MTKAELEQENIELKKKLRGIKRSNDLKIRNVKSIYSYADRIAKFYLEHDFDDNILIEQLMYECMEKEYEKVKKWRGEG